MVFHDLDLKILNYVAPSRIIIITSNSWYN